MEQMRLNFEAAEKPAAPEKPADEAGPRESAAPKILSVSDINKAIKTQLEGSFRQIWIKGEISNFKAHHGSGHFYFALKDSKASISCVMFRGFNQSMKFKPADGLEVIVRGKITVYEPRGNYQIFCEMMEPVGAGALQLAFDQLKKRLDAEGLFHPARKRALPALPRHVAVVTSPTGAAIRDIVNILGRRFKGLRVTVIPAVVQGDAAPNAICRGIEMAHRLGDVDVLIVGRGGGSIEDLWGFNDERVARAIHAARMPVISAVGHEIDFTIADFVADLRAPTPSAAAELVCKNAAELHELIDQRAMRLKRALAHRFQLGRQAVAGASRRLIDPKRRLQDLSLRCDELSQRLDQGIARLLAIREQKVLLLHARLPSPRDIILRFGQRIEMLANRLHTSVHRPLEAQHARWARATALLDAVSPLRVVERGFTITKLKGEVVKSVRQIAAGDQIELTFAQGRAIARVDSVMEGE